MLLIQHIYYLCQWREAHRNEGAQSASETTALQRVPFCDQSIHSHPTSVIQEEPERALDAVKEAVDDHVVDVLHVGLPLLRGVLDSEQLQVFLRHDQTRRTH